MRERRERRLLADRHLDFVRSERPQRFAKDDRIQRQA
jgi:hypothetical protein